MNAPLTLRQAVDQGYIVDSNCTPWVAYKGPRFNPTEMQVIFVEQPAIHEVAEFHLKFNTPRASEPSFLDEALWRFRYNFLFEELAELQKAYEEEDMNGLADALIDLIYVALGTADTMGLTPHWQSMWEEVHGKNMAKVRAKDASESKRGSKVDVIKPEGWTPPDHSKWLGNGPWPTLKADDDSQ